MRWAIGAAEERSGRLLGAGNQLGAKPAGPGLGHPVRLSGAWVSRSGIRLGLRLGVPGGANLCADWRPALEGRDIDWAPIKRSRVITRLYVGGTQHAVAVDGRCLRGDPLSKPERSDVNIPDAWDLLFQSYAEMCSSMRDLAYHWTRPLTGA